MGIENRLASTETRGIKGGDFALETTVQEGLKSGKGLGKSRGQEKSWGEETSREGGNRKKSRELHSQNGGWILLRRVFPNARVLGVQEKKGKGEGRKNGFCAGNGTSSRF